MTIVASGGTISYVFVGGIRQKIHTFTTSGTFAVTSRDPADTIEILMVAGGGGGANARDGGGGGGGAGGLLYSSSFSAAVGSYSLVVGAGGPNQTGGTNTTGFGATAIGGGRAGGGPRGGQYAAGSGGSGGGGTGFDTYSAAGSATQGNSNGLTGYGNNGGAPGGGGGSGGGAGAAGVTNGAGGIGRQYSISGTATHYAGGGGCPGFAGGLGGGAAGVSNADGNSGTVNTGGGAGAIYDGANVLRTGASGGSGIIILRYADPAPDGFDAGNPSSVYGGETINLVFYHAASSAASATVSYTITGVTTSDIMGASLTGNFTLINGQYLVSIPTKPKLSETKTLTISALTYSTSVTINPGVQARYLIVAGGGGGGSNMGGGGGAGGYLAGTNLALTQPSYTITVGAGGAGATAGADGPAGSNGQNTTALGLTAIGGGGGASDHDSASFPAGNGGSGGGGSGGRQSLASYGGLPGTGTAGQGFNGAASGVTWYPGGGGGSAAAAIQTGSLQADGGAGTLNDITGVNLYWAGGGAGAGYSTFGGNGGIGGGGGGAPRQSAATTNGTGGGSALNAGSAAEIGTLNAQTNKRGGAAGANTGSGGGGGSHFNLTNDGGAGGSGIVVVRYPGAQRAVGGTITTVGTDTVHTFTTSGTLQVYQAGIAASTTSTNWGNSVTFTFGADEPDGGTIPYTITGVTSQEINNASLTGNFTFTNGLATLTVQFSTVTQLKTSTLVLSSSSYSVSVSVTNFLSLTASSLGTFWGGTIRFNVNTVNLPNDTLIPYTITGVTSAQINNASLTGNIVNYLSPSANYSVFFDGTGDYLTIPDQVDFEMVTDFTVEAYFMLTATPGSFGNIVSKGAAGIFQPYYIYVNSSLSLLFNSSSTGSSWDIASSVSLGTVVLNRWYHVAVSRQGSSIRLFLNGSLITTITNSNPLFDNDRAVAIGARSDGTETITGYISNVRITKSLAVYIGAFTVPTAPLQRTQLAGTNISAITGTEVKLLTCRSATVKDLSSSVKTITTLGNSVVRAYNPTPTAFSYFYDGSADFITVTGSSNFDFSSGNFTLECWIYPTTLSGTKGILDAWNNAPTRFLLRIVNNSLQFYTSYGGPIQFDLSTIGALNTWIHVAAVRNGSTTSLYVNGVSRGTPISSSTAITASTALWTISGTGTESFQGYISNVRVAKGLAIYTGNFTPPASPLMSTQSSGTNISAITGTSVTLLTCKSGSIIDESSSASVLTVSGATRVDSLNPFQFTYSNYFDGTGDFLTLSDNAALNPGTSDFVMEAWVYITGTTGNNQGLNGKGTAGTDGYSFFITNGLVLSFVWNGTGGATITAGTLSLNTWNHVAVVRNSNVIRLYLNGVGAGSSTACTTDITSTATKFIGQARGGSPMLGYISNYRMTKGTLPSGYNATLSTITVPTSILTAITSTSLLTCQSNRFIDNSTNNFTITKSGDAAISDFVPELDSTSTLGLGQGTLTITTNSSEPILNQATLLLDITADTESTLIRTSNPRVTQRLVSSVQSLEFIDTEVTDVHNQDLEARISTIAALSAQFEPIRLTSSMSSIEFIDTEVTDVHKQDLEARVSTIAVQNAQLEPNKLETNLLGFIAAPTFAYSSGEDVKVSPPPVQTWYL